MTTIHHFGSGTLTFLGERLGRRQHDVIRFLPEDGSTVPRIDFVRQFCRNGMRGAYSIGAAHSPVARLERRGLVESVPDAHQRQGRSLIGLRLTERGLAVQKVVDDWNDR